MKPSGILTATMALALAAMSHQASAQLNNAPYQLRAGNVNVGMSDAYRQAILHQEIHGVPDGQIYRAPSGGLMIMEPGRGNLAISVGADGQGEHVVTPRRRPAARIARSQGFGYGGRDGVRMSSSSAPIPGATQSAVSGRDSLSLSQVRGSTGVSVVSVWTAQLSAMAE